MGNWYISCIYLFHLSSRRSKPTKDQFYDDIFVSEYLGNDSDEDEEIPLPTSEDLDKYLQSIELVKRLIEARGVINCHCGEAVYDYMELRSHMVEKHIVRKRPIEYPIELTEDDKIRHRSIQEEVFFVAPKALAEEAAKRGQSFDLMIYGKGLPMVDPSSVKAKEVTHKNDEKDIAEESDEVISAKYLLPLLRSWRREYVCR